MRIAVEEAILEGHLEDGFRPYRGHVSALGRGQQEGVDVVEAGPLDELHREHPFRGELSIDSRDPYWGLDEVSGKAAGVFGLGLVVELAPDHALELREELRHVDKDPVPKPRVYQRRKVPHEPEIRLDPLRRLRPLHLDRHDLPVAEPRPVHLPDARRPELYRVELDKKFLDRNPELSLDDRLRYLQGDGRRRVLELLELEENTLGDDIRAGGQVLANLHERRP